MKKFDVKIGLISLAFMFVAVLSSCSSKQCRCYELFGNRWTGPTTVDTYEGNSCGDLNTSTYLCNEMDEPILNPDDIAVGKKK